MLRYINQLKRDIEILDIHGDTWQSFNKLHEKAVRATVRSAVKGKTLTYHQTEAIMDLFKSNTCGFQDSIKHLFESPKYNQLEDKSVALVILWDTFADHLRSRKFALKNIVGRSLLEYAVYGNNIHTLCCVLNLYDETFAGDLSEFSEDIDWNQVDTQFHSLLRTKLLCMNDDDEKREEK